MRFKYGASALEATERKSEGWSSYLAFQRSSKEYEDLYKLNNIHFLSIC